MNSLVIKDLSDSVELDHEAMARVRGGWFFAFPSSSGTSTPSVSVHDLTATKKTDTASPILM